MNNCYSETFATLYSSGSIKLGSSSVKHLSNKKSLTFKNLKIQYNVLKLEISVFILINSTIVGIPQCFVQVCLWKSTNKFCYESGLINF